MHPLPTIPGETIKQYQARLVMYNAQNEPTPGPWTHRQVSANRRLISAPHNNADGCIEIAMVVGWPESEANARVMAAAPELLAALREMLDVMIDGEWGTPAHAKAELKARAAITKATVR